MPFPRHYLAVLGGNLGRSGQPILDEWQCTIRIGDVSGGLPNGFDLVEDDYITNQLRPAIEAWMADSNGPWSLATELTYVKFNAIGTDGKYADQTTTHRYDYPAGSTVRGVQNPISHDPAQALCITWTTSHKRGPAHAGRMFVPMPGVPLGTNGRVPGTNLDALLGTCNTFIQGLHVSGLNTTSHSAVVVSNRGASGAMLEVQGVRVGDVIDHQLRRRDRMVEAYHALTF